MSDAGNPSDKVKGPAVAVLIVGVLGILFGLLGLLNNLFGLGLAKQLEQMKEQGQEVPPWATALMGGGAGALAIVGNLIGIAGAAFIVYAGLQMQKHKNHTLCMVASVIAMVPCISPCCCIGIPIGIWALIVLNKPDVKQSFS
jgi:hypothetical protein